MIAYSHQIGEKVMPVNFVQDNESMSSYGVMRGLHFQQMPYTPVSYTHLDVYKRQVFLSAWNEWGEGNYMEPDLKWGHGYLEALKLSLIHI